MGTTLKMPSIGTISSQLIVLTIFFVVWELFLRDFIMGFLVKNE